MLKNTIIFCAFGGKTASVQFMTVQRLPTKGHFWQHNLIFRAFSQG